MLLLNLSWLQFDGGTLQKPLPTGGFHAAVLFWRLKTVVSFTDTAFSKPVIPLDERANVIYEVTYSCTIPDVHPMLLLINTHYGFSFEEKYLFGEF